MSDLEKRLRSNPGSGPLMREAADTLAAVRERVENRLRPGAQDMERTAVYAFAQELQAILDRSDTDE